MNSNLAEYDWDDYQEDELPEIKIVKKDPKHDGMSCLRCKEFVFMAEPNQQDGTFKCYSCRQNKYR